ncbi:MAG TPA: RpiB/LacA/LacB family sugar-phosphate isomerase [Paludibacter sp.]|nr:RpiB/LacA/LacB family sugar-phosphate isomerase [Paludibacter sp.]
MNTKQSNEQEFVLAAKDAKVIGIAADHGGYKLKLELVPTLRNQGYKIIDFGAYELKPDDDYPEFVIPMAKAMMRNEIFRGLAICGSGVGACIASNKVPGVRAALITDSFSAHQGVEDDDMNVLCLGGQITGYHLAIELVSTFLNARFKGEDRFKRRIAKITSLEEENRLE